MGDFERYAGSAELFVGILASRLIGIDDRQRAGNAVGSRQVMVGDDQVDAEALRGFGGGEGADAHVDADDEANACGCGAFDHIVAQIVAFANAVRHVKIGGASAEFDCRFQDDDRHGAIDVVVAVDEDGFFSFDGGVDAVDGGAKAEHFFGCVQMIERREQEASCGVGIGDATTDEQASERVKWTALLVMIPRLIRNREI